ncbi:SRPBCC family protein [Ilumatobacter nonamiensis]|uniref:SRPBCC family protein n=1 Tax=Ilumatobacter nonamiensis TaxID=467093 RepID=UPI0003481D37|nr:SRPBCC family protein [Ilumatobacter nonamiensis]
MPRVEATRTVPVPLEIAFAVSQTHGPIRLEWDPFVRSQHLIDADEPAKGVRTRTVSRHRLKMTSEYVSYRPPTQVGMKMVEGPWFFSSFGGGWTFAAGASDQETLATWRYTFRARPTWLAPIADRVGVWLLGRDIEKRLEAYAAACRNPSVLAAVHG